MSLAKIKNTNDIQSIKMRKNKPKMINKEPFPKFTHFVHLLHIRNVSQSLYFPNTNNKLLFINFLKNTQGIERQDKLFQTT